MRVKTEPLCGPTLVTTYLQGYVKGAGCPLGGQVYVNGQAATKDTVIHPGDVVEVRKEDGMAARRALEEK